jgi:hypothetical protein
VIGPRTATFDRKLTSAVQNILFYSFQAQGSEVMSHRNRREFMADVGRGMLVASVGSAVAGDLGLTPAWAGEAVSDKIEFGALEPLVGLMQDTPAEKLMPILVEKINDGTDLRTLVTAGALANVRSFAGEDYIGFHTFMALMPALEMSRELAKPMAPLPVLKVLYRNTNQMQARGGHKHEKLHPVEPAALPADRQPGELLVDMVRKGDRNGAERAFAAMAKGSSSDAFNHLQYAIHDITADFAYDVHRVVLSWRAWLMLDLAGQQYAHTLLRQSVRYCLMEENHGGKGIRKQLPKLFDTYKLEGRELGTRQADDAWIDSFSKTIYSSSCEQAADATAAALADGISPESIGEALSLAANSLLLHDPGRREGGGNKPVGSCHGDSVGVHASDAINAWRNIARVSNHHNTVASLVVGAYHISGQSGGMSKETYPLAEQLSAVTATDPAALLTELNAAIAAKDQFKASAVATRYAASGAEARPIFDLLLKIATSEDGALHAEKYYRTVSEEFAKTRASFRWRHVVGLARVSASEYGQQAPGYAQAKQLLKV